MIKKELRGKATMVLCAVLAVSVCVMPVSAKSKKVRISRTSLTMEKGAKIRLKIKRLFIRMCGIENRLKAS